jgi:hypothetical protein
VEAGDSGICHHPQVKRVDQDLQPLRTGGLDSRPTRGGARSRIGTRSCPAAGEHSGCEVGF